MTGSTIAITGIGCRLPGANSVDAFWELILSGRTTFTSTEGAGTGNGDFVPVVSTLDEFDMFEPQFFGIAAHDALVMDPQQRILLETAWGAIEDGGYASSIDTHKVGVFASVSNSTYLSGPLTRSGRWDESDPSYPIMIGNDKDFAASRISFAFGFTGPTYAIQSACSSSLVAVHAACQALVDGMCDLAVVAASSISLPFLAGYHAKAGSIFSPTGQCRPFSDDSDGTVKGNGALAVVLRRREVAAAADDRLYAEISGWGINNDGARKTGIAAPSVIGQREAVETALTCSGVVPASVGYIETHGTGTRIGDPIELRALIDGYQLDRRAETERPYLGSLKATMGHLDAAAGVAGLAKAALVLHHQRIPPLAGFTRLNPLISAAGAHVRLPKTAVRPAHVVESAAVTSLGMGGTNAHAILSRVAPSAEPDSGGDLRRVRVSARTGESLQRFLVALGEWIERHPDVPLGAIADSLASRKVFDVFVEADACTPSELAARLLAARPRTSADGGEAYSNESASIRRRYRPVSIPPYQWTRERYIVEPTVTASENTASAAKADTSAGTLNDRRASALRTMKQVLDDDGIALGDSFFDVGGDSLSAIDLIDVLKQEHPGALLTFDDMERHPTARELGGLIHRRLAEEGDRDDDRTNAVHLTPQPPRERLFLTHPAGGSVSMYRDLARHLADTWDVVGLSFPRSRLSEPGSLHALAAAYASTIRGLQPAGPYFLGGYSMGGNLSIEIAKALETEGHFVPAIVMYDSHATSDYLAPAVDEQSQARAIRALVRHLPDALGASDQSDAEGNGSPGELSTFLQIWKHNQQALASWEPDNRRVESQLLLFRATADFPPEIADAVGFRPTGPETWRDFTHGDLVVEDVDASHYTLFDDPRLISTMAESTRRFLAVHQGARVG